MICLAAPARGCCASDRGGGTGWACELVLAFADQAAGLYMHLGRPADARRTGSRPGTVLPKPPPVPPGEHVLGRARLRGRFSIFVRRPRPTPNRQRPGALAMLHAQQGDARARKACRQGLQVPSTRQPADLDAATTLKAQRPVR
jgi:hypothetical protein